MGKEIYLVSNSFSDFNVQGRQGFRLMKFEITAPTTSTFAMPSVLSEINPISESQSINTRRFNISAMAGGLEGGGHGMGKHSINGKTFEMDRVDEVVSAGATEIWEFDNLAGDEIHPMHVHGVQFQVLERIGGRNIISASEKGWKDTVLVMAGEKVRLIMTFPEYTGVFVMHCHNLEHEDDGMMINFRIM
jgi:blue copper oxidase